MKRAYVPALGPVQRRKLIREAARAAWREKPGEFARKFDRKKSAQSVHERIIAPSRREHRVAVAKMFGFHPLVQLSPPEMSAVKHFYSVSNWKTMLRFFERYGEMIDPKRYHWANDPMDRKTALRVVSRTERNGPSLGYYGSRNAASYVKSGIDVFRLVEEAFQRTGRRVGFLDVGCSQADMLFDLKERMGGKVETHGLAPHDEPKFPIDQFHFLCAEYMPREFRRKFDVIVSKISLEYAFLPGLALRNIAEALAPGGTAILYYYPREFHPPEESKRFLERYPGGFLTPEAVKLSNELLKREGERPATESVLKAVRDSPNFVLQRHFTWLNEAARLRASGEFETFEIGFVGIYAVNEHFGFPDIIKFVRKAN